MAKGMKKSANEKLRDKYGLTNVKSEPVTKKQKEVAVTQSATGGRKSSLQGAAIGTSKPTTPKKPAQIKAQDSPLLSAAKRFVSNPVGTVSDAVMKPIDDITERITSPSKKLKQEQNRLTQNRKQANSKQTDVGRLLGGMAVKAADDVVSGAAGLGDMTLGTAARAFGWENNPFSQWNKLAQVTQQANREYYSKNTANAGKVVQTVDELGTALVEALPQLAIAYMTAGGSLATEGAGAIAQATGRLAGTEAAQAASKLPEAIKTARAVANNLKSDPQFWTSFADMSGRYYNDAKQDGADDWTATMYALATGIMNAGIEIGGGIQKLPGEMKNTEKSLLSLLKSAHKEGTEEPIQGIIERASQNLILGRENPLFSLTDENAVFNPKTAAKEYGTGAAVGFGLGAVPAIRRGIQNSTNQPTPDMIAEVVKATPDPARAVQNIQAMQTRQAEQNATQAAPAASSGIQELEIVKQAIGRNPTFDDLVNYYSQQGETGFQSYQRIADAFERGELVDGGNSGIYTRAEIEQRQTSMPEADHIDNRTPEYNSKVSTKPFQLTHPELHPYFAEAAKALQQEAVNSFMSDMPNLNGGKVYNISVGLKRVMDMTGLSRQQISECCQDIIDNHGAEDYASAKHVEAALDYLMTNGAQFQSEVFPSNQAYLEAKGKITGGTDPNTFDYALEHEYGDLIAMEEMTVDEARADWERNHPQQTPANQANAAFAEQTPANQANAEPAVTPESSVPQRNGLPEGQGAMSAQFPYREAPSQTNSLDSSLTPEERQMDGMEITHQVRTDADVDAHAKERFDFDYDGEKESLFNGDGEWDAVDTALAEMIIANEVIEANKTGDYSEVIRLRKSMAERNANWGQVGHTLARYSETPEATIAEAATTLSEDRFSHLKDEAKAKIMEEVKKEAYALQNAKRTGKPENVIDIIKRLNGKRKTGGFFRPKHTGRTLEKTLNAVAKQDGGMDFLYKVAQGQINGLVTDNLKLSPLETLKSLRYMSMLSKITTYMRNIGGNNVFDPVESVSTDAGTLFDLFMSARTGRRALPFDKSWFSKAKRKGTSEATQRAYIETALDVDVSGIQGSYEQRTGRNFKMNSRNPLIRFLSSIEKWQRYALNVTDEAQKGGIQAEAQRGIDSLKARGLLEQDALKDAAEKTAKDRTFQSEDGKVAGALLHLRNAGNQWSLTDSKGGSIGVGDLALPFARVPGNLVGQLVNYSPAGVINGVVKMGNVMIKGKNATAEEQRAAALAVGRGLNGTAILTAFAAMAANGLLNVADGGDTDDEKDLAKLEQAGGVTGTQWNVSATERWKNGESTEWRNDDNLVNIGFLEPINGLMALGSLLWDAAQDEDGITALDVANASFESLMQAFADLPAMSTITDIADTYKYSTAEKGIGKAAEAASSFVGSSLTSVVPNALAGIAQGVDEGTVRDAYATEKSGLAGVMEETLNVAKSKIPGQRETLPVALDNLGNERKTTASAFMNWLNSNILPGSITKYQSTRISEEAKKLAETGEKLNVPDRKAPNKISVNGENVELTADQKRVYQQTYGAEASRSLNALIQSKEYRKMSSAEKAAAWNNVVKYAEAKAKQKVDGKKDEDSDLPSWATKSDGTVMQNAVYNAQYQTARNTAKQATGKDSPSDGEVLISLSNRGLDYDTTVKIMAQFMEPNTIKKYETAYADGYDFGLSAAFSGAYYEKSYDFGTTDSGNPKQRGKDGTIQWAVDNLGLTKAQATMLYNYLIKR